MFLLCHHVFPNYKNYPRKQTNKQKELSIDQPSDRVCKIHDYIYIYIYNIPCVIYIYLILIKVETIGLNT